ncbi:MAG: signal peptide peptidase SppA [Candidatus Scalindua sp.]|nr:signal peptide peptidase SppA [Candidatus Scalindua sp.]
MKQKSYSVQRLPYLWSILPQELNRIRASIHELDEEKAKVFFEDPDTAKSKKSFYMQDNIAILNIEGVIQPKADLWSWLFGGTTLDVLTKDFKSLIANDDVQAIILDIDSPGGVVSCIQEFANLVYESRSKKPIFAVSSTMATSAACWIASAAEKVFITGEAVMTGSIGVVVSHVDISELEKKLGIRTTEITAGKKKRIVSSYEPLTPEGREELQKQVDHVYGAFTGDIAKFRNVPVETVVSDMADGQVFLGSQGVKAGLVDALKTSEGILAEIGEAARIRGIDSISFPGYEALISAAKADGISTAETVAVKILSAIREKRQAEKILPFKGSTGTGTATVENLPKTKSFKKGDIMNKSDSCAIEAEEKSLEEVWSTSESTRAEFRNDKESFLAYHKYRENVGNRLSGTLKTDESYEANGENLQEGSLKTKWEASEETREEFKGNFESFKAYEENVIKGNVRIFNPRTEAVRGTRETTSERER